MSNEYPVSDRPEKQSDSLKVEVLIGTIFYLIQDLTKFDTRQAEKVNCNKEQVLAIYANIWVHICWLFEIF